MTVSPIFPVAETIVQNGGFGNGCGGGGVGG